MPGKKCYRTFNMKPVNFASQSSRANEMGSELVTLQQTVCNSFFLFEFNFWCNMIEYKNYDAAAAAVTVHKCLCTLLDGNASNGREKGKKTISKIYIQSQFIWTESSQKKKR